MNIDELEWPDDAEFYAPETDDYFGGFYKRKDGKWLFMRDDMNEWAEEWDVPSAMFPRPETAWKDGIPPIGVACEWRAVKDADWSACRILGTHENLVWLKSGACHITANTELSDFRMIQPTMREKLIQLILSVGNMSEGVLADTIISHYDLTEKKK